MPQPVTYELVGPVAVLGIDNPPVNALSQPVRQALLAQLTRALEDPAAAAIVIVCEGRTFIAGADIREFGKPPRPPALPDLIDAIESSAKPVVAGMHGTALGGGLEVALGCHYRVALPGTRVGLPEVTLGLLPGAGGTQRAPRLAGVERALELMTSGKPLDTRAALEAGLLDEVCNASSARDGALAFAGRVVRDGLPVRRTRDLHQRLDEARADPGVLHRFRATLAQRSRGEIAPGKIVDCVQAALESTFEQGLARERELFLECMNSPQRAGLVHAFFAERAVAKIPESGQAEARAIASAGVIGGGTMGAGIATALLQQGIAVTLIERDAHAADSARGRVEANLERAASRGRLAEGLSPGDLRQRFSTGTRYASLAGVDLAIEAVFEDMALKRDVFAKLDAVCKTGAILATNTSYLDVDEIAAATARPEDVIGLHFFSPANLMKLVEVVVARHTAPAVTLGCFALARRLGKTAVRSGVCDGFIGNRLLAHYRKAAEHLVLDGASPYEVDAALVEFGYPMGPFAVSDLAGLDIGWANRRRLAPSRDPRERYAEFADRLCERGWFGQKTGRGYYVYAQGERRGKPNPALLDIVAAERKAKGLAARAISPAEIVERYLAAMINEAARVLEEGIALRPLDIDVVLLNGYAFPRYRGGPMKYADQRGLRQVLADVRRFAAHDEYFWQAAPLLVDLAKRGADFESLDTRA